MSFMQRNNMNYMNDSDTLKDGSETGHRKIHPPPHLPIPSSSSLQEDTKLAPHFIAKKHVSKPIVARIIDCIKSTFPDKKPLKYSLEYFEELSKQDKYKSMEKDLFAKWKEEETEERLLRQKKLALKIRQRQKISLVDEHISFNSHE